MMPTIEQLIVDYKNANIEKQSRAKLLFILRNIKGAHTMTFPKIEHLIHDYKNANLEKKSTVELTDAEQYYLLSKAVTDAAKFGLSFARVRLGMIDQEKGERIKKMISDSNKGYKVDVLTTQFGAREETAVVVSGWAEPGKAPEKAGPIRTRRLANDSRNLNE